MEAEELEVVQGLVEEEKRLASLLVTVRAEWVVVVGRQVEAEKV